MVISGPKKPPRWQKGDPTRDSADCKRTPIHIPECHCADLHRQPGRIDCVDNARLLGDWISKELDETAAADMRVAAATRAFLRTCAQVRRTEHRRSNRAQ